mmetsp:Transcript_24185/g.51033  ORF Transcript_24185/g.51033 Transcript_24185/m.51033 type:complete len:101 (-) Transcript_24185:660-962(-)
MPSQMPQHSPIEEDFAHTTHSIGEEYVNEGYGSRNSTLKAGTTRVDEFKCPVKNGDNCFAYPGRRRQWNDDANEDCRIKCEDGTNCRPPEKIYPNNSGRM